MKARLHDHNPNVSIKHSPDQLFEFQLHSAVHGLPALFLFFPDLPYKESENQVISSGQYIIRSIWALVGYLQKQSNLQLILGSSAPVTSCFDASAATLAADLIALSKIVYSSSFIFTIFLHLMLLHPYTNRKNLSCIV